MEEVFEGRPNGVPWSRAERSNRASATCDRRARSSSSWGEGNAILSSVSVKNRSCSDFESGCLCVCNKFSVEIYEVKKGGEIWNLGREGI